MISELRGAFLSKSTKADASCKPKLSARKPHLIIYAVMVHILQILRLFEL